MSRLQRDKYFKRVRESLALADDEGFFQLLWAAEALQSDRESVARNYISYPPGAATDDISAQLSVRPWERETLIMLLLTIAKKARPIGAYRVLRHDDFTVVLNLVGNLRNLENEEYGLGSRADDVFVEMRRIRHRQFPWQSEPPSANLFYRYNFVYGGDLTKEYFSNLNDVSVNTFSLVIFAIWSVFVHQPVLSRRFSLREMDVVRSEVAACLSILALPIRDARLGAVRLRNGLGARYPIAYQPSILRRYPVVSFGSNDERLRCPLLNPLIWRTTSGLYYDFVNAPMGVRNEIAKRYEEYVAQVLIALADDFVVEREFRYNRGARGKPQDTPDVFLLREGNVQIIIECKATKLTLPAQLSDNPLEEAKQRYKEIQDGIVQIWRYIADVRLGYAAKFPVSPSAVGLVLTLDPGFMADKELQNELLANATLVAAKDANISEVDRRPISFGDISELERILYRTDGEGLLQIIRAASEPKYRGWDLQGLYNELNSTLPARRNRFPFDLGSVLPWWAEMDRRYRAGDMPVENGGESGGV